MPERGEHNLKKFFSSRWFVWVMLGIILFVGVAYARAYYREYEVRAEIARLQDEARRLEAKKLETMEILKYVQSRQFVEDQARTELNLVKPGEHLAVIATASEAGAGQKNDEMVKYDRFANFKNWWEYFVKGKRINN